MAKYYGTGCTYVSFPLIFCFDDKAMFGALPAKSNSIERFIYANVSIIIFKHLAPGHNYLADQPLRQTARILMQSERRSAPATFFWLTLFADTTRQTLLGLTFVNSTEE